jgi:cellulose synthase/poly-beta-1,6-N-acetylglucosamine synthase-like glycosyltransferase
MHNQITARFQTGQPKVSVIVPARDEEANLDRCLRSLVQQRGIAYEIIVVDDGSTDKTWEIAETFTRANECPFLVGNIDLVGVTVLSARMPLPEGWSGKSNACASGVGAARGEWLLFTDADTEHLELSLAHAVAEAEEHSVALLSYSPEQVITGASQHALMPLVFSELATVYKPRQICDPHSKVAAANGQYMLIRRSVLDSVGGFGAVADTLLEDVALAQRVKATGKKIRFRLGAGLVRTRMYRNWSEMQAGWTKNLALLFQHPRRLAVSRLLEFLFLVLLPVFAVMSAAARHEMLALVEAVVASIFWIEFLVRVSRAHFGFATSVFSVFGLPLFSALLLHSHAAHAHGRILWKGRTYPGSVTSKPSQQSNGRGIGNGAASGK